MQKVLLIVIILVQATLSEAQEFRFGLYTRNSSRVFEQVSPSLIADRNLNLSYLFNFEKPIITVYIEKDTADIALHTDKPEFFFYLPSDRDSTTLSVKSMVGLIKNYPFIYAESPEDFILVPIFNMRRGRAIRLAKEKYFYGTNFKPFKDDIIDYNIISMPEDNAYKIELTNPLPKGEYGFIYNRPTPYDMVIYDFRIE